MIYKNPIIKGFYADPSVCEANGKYYLVTSTMQYFPGVPVFESEDLVNWKQIGNCLTRDSQVELENIESSSGVFAPTIRFHNDRFYMTTTNNKTRKHSIVYTDDIYGEWSEPIFIDQDGIDPSLYFEDNKVYFMSNGIDDFGISGVIQSEIDIETGKKLTKSKCVWQGSGGRYLEAPHLYKISDWYYLLAAEGGTEFGHMVTYARAKSPYGPFEDYPKNPVLTNRNLGGFEIQGVGHGDLIQDKHGDWFLIHLGFRQIGQWDPFHHLGRETFMTPVKFDSNGWFTAGNNGTTEEEYEIKGSFIQKNRKAFSFENTNPNLEWIHLREKNKDFYQLDNEKYILRGNNKTLNDLNSSPTFIGIRQKDFNALITCNLTIDHGEAGITLYMDEKHHYDLLLKKEKGVFSVQLKANIGPINHLVKKSDIKSNNVKLLIEATNNDYKFYYDKICEETFLGSLDTRYLSSEVATGFTGVIIGLFAHSTDKSNEAIFRNFKCTYK
ncbi:glycoside hydrolase family 43 protein [Haploplasma axanthum]|uniref:Beta-xylosidase n=1 Tax=Haploplasma axanthum TaxID=29552 RepID=A0A449BFA3_HAPAX|nr:glycoside hydrolase family 43 protein [Haploplasma axanthum]VEU81108.1 Beta-xylosidase [Haploplasma axanthum]